MRRTIRVILAGFGALALPVACAPSPPASDGGISPIPAHQLQWVRMKADSADPQTIQRLIEHLSSFDAVVRLSANARLEELTGTSMGFRYDDPLVDRRRAIDRWVDWYESSYQR